MFCSLPCTCLIMKIFAHHLHLILHICVCPEVAISRHHRFSLSLVALGSHCHGPCMILSNLSPDATRQGLELLRGLRPLERPRATRRVFHRLGRRRLQRGCRRGVGRGRDAPGGLRPYCGWALGVLFIPAGGGRGGRLAPLGVARALAIHLRRGRHLRRRARASVARPSSCSAADLASGCVCISSVHCCGR